MEINNNVIIIQKAIFPKYLFSAKDIKALYLSAFSPLFWSGCLYKPLSNELLYEIKIKI